MGASRASRREGEVPFRVRGGHLVVSGGAGGGEFKRAVGIQSRGRPAVRRLRDSENRQDMFALEVPESLGGGTGYGYGSGSGALASASSTGTLPRLALSGARGGAMHSSHSSSQPTLGLGLRSTLQVVPGPGGLGAYAVEDGTVGVYMHQARRKQRTKRTLLRPPAAATGRNTVIPGRGSTAASTESDRFVRKSQLIPGAWERSVAALGHSVRAEDRRSPTAELDDAGRPTAAHAGRAGELLRMSLAEPTVGGEVVPGRHGRGAGGGGGVVGAGAEAGTDSMFRTTAQRQRGMFRTYDARAHSTGPARTLAQQRRDRRVDGGAAAVDRIHATYRRENLLQQERDMSHAMARGKHSLQY